MPQLARVPGAKTGLLDDRTQKPAQVGRVEQRAAAGREDQPQVLPVLPHQSLMSQLAVAVLPQRVLGASRQTQLPPR